MKVDWSFVRLVAYCFVGSAGLAYYPLSVYASNDVMQSVTAGGIMGFVNLLLGYVAIEVGFDKSHTTFLKIVLGGMVVRLCAMWAALIVFVKVYDFNQRALVFSLLFVYVLTLILEIHFLQKKVSIK